MSNSSLSEASKQVTRASGQVIGLITNAQQGLEKLATLWIDQVVAGAEQAQRASKAVLASWGRLGG